MLVLTQKTDDKIHIGDDITVTILRVKGQIVKVGIEAPLDVHVLRDTLFHAQTHDLRSDIFAGLESKNCQPPRKPK